MKNQVLSTFSYFIIFTSVCIMLFFGVHFDLQSVATFLVTTIFAPILGFYTLQFIKKFSVSYLEVPDNFSRTILLQRIDPLLN